MREMKNGRGEDDDYRLEQLMEREGMDMVYGVTLKKVQTIDDEEFIVRKRGKRRDDNILNFRLKSLTQHANF